MKKSFSLELIIKFVLRCQSLFINTTWRKVCELAEFPVCPKNTLLCLLTQLKNYESQISLKLGKRGLWRRGWN